MNSNIKFKLYYNSDQKEISKSKYLEDKRESKLYIYINLTIEK